MRQSLRISLACVFTFLLVLTFATCGGTESSQDQNPPPTGSGPVTEAILYVANVDAETVSAFRVGSDGKLTLLPGSPFSGTADHITSNGSSLVFTSCDHIQSWRVAEDGSLTRAGTWSESLNGAPIEPAAMDVSPDGRHLYVQILGPQAGIMPFDIAADGTVNDQAEFLANDAREPDVSADGRAVVTSTALQSVTGVRSLLRNANGALSVGSSFDFPNPPEVRNAAVSPDSAMVAVGLSNGLALFHFDSATGAFTPLSGSPFPFGGTVNHIAWDATGGFVLAASGSGIRVFRVGNGTATEVAGQPAAEGTLFVAVSGNNRVLVTHPAGTVSAFRLDTTSGVLTRTDGPVQAGNGALEMTLVRR
jgi:6-phosphogluconolactonase (cycloisomerase 2 family)